MKTITVIDFHPYRNEQRSEYFIILWYLRSEINGARLVDFEVIWRIGRFGIKSYIGILICVRL